MAIDKITLEILKNHCVAAAESMAYTLYRTAHSTFVKETEDFTTGLATPAGLTYAAPTELGVTWFVGLNYGSVIKSIENYEEGDICVTNDPYSGFVCTHTPDMHIWKPIFHDGEIVSFAVGHIHNTDVGGAVPASLSRTLSEVHQEGIRIPPTKIVRRGEVNREVLDILLTNVRMPEQNWGDMKAQLAAVNTGERNVHEMIGKFGITTFREGIEDLLDYAEAQARDIIRGLPDGEYFFADYMDEDSVDGWPCRLALNLIIEGDSCTLDFTTSDPQLESSMNIPTGGEERHVMMLVGLVFVLYTLEPRLFLNSGVTRVSRCILPSGTIVNPEFPAAVGMRTLSAMRLQEITMGAFVQAAPDTLPASPCSGGPIMNVNSVDNRTGRRVMASIGPIAGGAGGNPVEDGTEASGANGGSLNNTPVEINEAEVPIKVLRYGLAPNSGGAGKHRGGLATEMRFQAQAPNTKVTARNRDRTRFRSWGVLAGSAGTNSVFLLNPGSNHEVNLGNTDILTIGPGDVLHVAAGGSGGWGDPLERDPEAVVRDIKSGFVTPDKAEAVYGVILRNGSYDVDGTKSLRAARMAEHKRNDAFFDFGPERQEFEHVWTNDNYAVLSDLISELPVHWRFFMKHRMFEAVATDPDGGSIHDHFTKIVKEYPEISHGIGL
ncbi:MAG: Acetophenone carboxylase delta subunit [Alphaproteobacteria bacterium MarineAlpha4_Bin2]|nr:MAG: Acetophenone carboxylase delta subunit [Alphaproteobacteria bacterium MarineAlpha4_Bin2]